MQSTARAKKATNAPKSASKLQAAADQRRQQLDQFAQQQKDHTKQERERTQREREAANQQRQQSEKKIKMTEDKMTRFVAFISEQEKRGRGRPKKVTTDAGDPTAEKRSSLVAQFRDRKPDSSGHYTVDIDGKSHKVHTSHAQRFIASHGAAKTADQKDAVERKFKSDLQSKK